jgi:hypothetical protein
LPLGRKGEHDMTSHWSASAAAFALIAATSGGALAQSAPFDATNSTQPNMSTNGPAGTYDMTTNRRIGVAMVS